jgi:hypothetical protein
MSQFFNSLKADLLDRRLLPFLALVAVALLAAVGYAVLGGGGSSTPTPTASSPSPQVSTKTGSIAVTPATTGAQQPVAETTHGASAQHGGPSRNPFTPLPGAKTASAPSSSTTVAKGGSTGSSSSGKSTSPTPTKSSGATSPAPKSPAKPAPAKPRVAYQVDVLFGAGPVGTVPPSIQLTPLNDLTRLQPLRSAGGEAPLVFVGVAAGGKSAIFTLMREVILHGPAVCGPSASQCQTIRLSPGQVEELEYIVPGGQSLLYKLQLVSITAVKASAAKAASLFRAESKVGRALLHRDGVSALPGMWYSQDKGVVVIGGWSAFAARAARARAARAHAALER